MRPRSRSSRDPARDLQFVPAHVRARAHPAGKRFTDPGKMPRPRTSGASSLLSNSACMPRQIPRNGTPARDAFQQRVPHCHSSSARIIWPKWPTPGQDDLRRALQPGGIAHQLVLAADLGQRVLHRAQIAGAVIEDRDHSSPLVDGNWSFSRASFEQAYFMARAKHLKIASIL